jgi:hypothetical protein
LPPSDPRKQNSNAYALTAIAGLLILAMHAMGLGVMNPSQVLNGRALSYAFPEIWPYLALALGVFARRRWARDLAAPTACLALVAALAVFPRFVFLDMGYSLSHPDTASATLGRTWLIFRQMLIQQAIFTGLCVGTFYALTRPSLVAECRADLKQPAWTDGLSFAALLPLSRQFFTASDALNLALYRFPDWADLHQIPWTASPAALLASPALKNLEPCAMAALALSALAGLWKRRRWGWTAMCAQTLILLFGVAQAGFGSALTAFYQYQDKAPSAAPALASEAFCRTLPDLAVLACVLVALLKSRRQFGR